MPFTWQSTTEGKKCQGRGGGGGDGLCALKRGFFCGNFGSYHTGEISGYDPVSCNWDTSNGTHFIENHLYWSRTKLAGYGIFRCCFTESFFGGGEPVGSDSPIIGSMVTGDATLIAGCLRKILQPGKGLGDERFLRGVPPPAGDILGLAKIDWPSLGPTKHRVSFKRKPGQLGSPLVWLLCIHIKYRNYREP